MTDRRPTLFWPLGPAALLIPGFAVAGVVVASTSAMLSWPYQEWIRTSAQFHQQNAFVAPLAAAVATYYAGRLTPPARIFALPSGARAGGPTVARHLLVLSTVLLGGYVVGFVPLLWRTARTTSYGYPDLPVIGSGLLGVTAGIAAGYLIGVVGRTAYLAPLSFVLLFAVTMAGSSGDQFAALAPVLHVSPVLGQVEATPLLLYRIAFLVAVVGAAALASANVLRTHRDWSPWPRPQSLAWVAVPALLVVPPLVRTPALFAPEQSPPRTCQTSQGLEMCVHIGHQSQLPALVDSIDPILAAYGPAPRAVTRVYDRALLGTPLVGPPPVWYSIDPNNAVAADIGNVTAALAGSDACADRYPEPAPDGRVPEAVQAAQQLEGWLRYHGHPPDGFPLAGVPVPVMQDWIARRHQQIAACALTPRELPR